MQYKNLASLDELSEYVKLGGTATYLLFWGHQPAKDGSVSKACLSQWFESAFEIDGIRYQTAEHYMMAEKARLFSDNDALQRILLASSPVEAKSIGKQILGFDEQTWLAHRWQIVIAANLAKFSQNQKLGDFLIDTGNAVLVEASPVDRIWGIGMAANHPAAENPALWNGLNLLGFALMQVREELREKI